MNTASGSVRARFSECGFIVYPCLDDGFVCAVEPEVKPKSAKNLRAPPMAIGWPECVAKLKFRSVRITRCFDEDQVQNAFEKSCFGVSAKVLGLLFFDRFHSLDRRLQRLAECWTGVQSPPVSFG